MTLKAVFLLALASAKRVGELQDLSYDVKHTRGWKSLAFEFILEFIAKTQNTSVHDERFVSFSIPSLGDFVDNDPDKMLLCPVRVLCAYLKRTRDLRPGHRSFDTFSLSLVVAAQQVV